MALGSGVCARISLLKRALLSETESCERHKQNDNCGRSRTKKPKFPATNESVVAIPAAGIRIGSSWRPRRRRPSLMPSQVAGVSRSHATVSSSTGAWRAL